MITGVNRMLPDEENTTLEEFEEQEAEQVDQPDETPTIPEGEIAVENFSDEGYPDRLDEDGVEPAPDAIWLQRGEWAYRDKIGGLHHFDFKEEAEDFRKIDLGE